MCESKYPEGGIGALLIDRIKRVLPPLLAITAGWAVIELAMGASPKRALIGHSFGLGEAWQAWAAGKLPDDSLLWGREILFWGRIGKAIQFAAAVTVLFEIIGPERLRRFGDSLHEGFSATKVKRLLDYVRAWHVAWWRGLTFQSGVRYSSQTYQAVEGWRVMVYALIVSPLFVFCFIKATTGDSWFWVTVLAVGAILLSLASATITVIVVVGLGLIALLMDLIVIEPVASVLEQPHLDKLIKIGSLFALAAGFHFDLLAS